MSHHNHPISALLPVKNGQDFLQDLIPSIIKMLNLNDELIVINDGSTDQSRDIIEKFVASDSRIKIVITPGVGLVHALNLGVDAAQNSWIARFDVDDTYSSLRLESQREMIDDGVSLIFSDYDFISRMGHKLGRVYTAVFPMQSALALISSQRAPHPVVLINKDLLIQSGGYQEVDFPVEDLSLWLRMSSLGKVLTVPESLLGYRLSVGSISNENRNVQIRKKNELIGNSTLWRDLQTNCQNSFRETILLYQKTPYSNHRIFLHLRDLLIAGSITGVRVPTFTLLYSLGFTQMIKVFIAGLEISSLALIRKLYRISQNYL